MIKIMKNLQCLCFLIVCFLPQAALAQNNLVSQVPDVRTAVFSQHGRFAVQLFYVDSRHLAQHIVARFQQGGSPAYYVWVQDPLPTKIGTFFAIRIGAFDLRSQAQNFGRTYLTPLGYEFTVEEREGEQLVGEDEVVQVDTIVNVRDTLHLATRLVAPTQLQPDLAPLLFSVGPELVKRKSVMGAGLTFELGTLYNHGLYFAAELSGGGVYYGGMLNLGRRVIGYDKNMRHIAGISGGYLNVRYLITFTEDGNKIDNHPVRNRTMGNNRAFGGIFWKILSGDVRNFDLTNRVLFGFKENPVWYYREPSRVEWKREFNAVYSVSIGYTFKRRRSANATGGE